jgi:carboxyl-terminal processing protease
MSFLRATLQAIPDRMKRNELFRAALGGMLSPWDLWVRALSPVEHDMALFFFGFYEEGTGVIIGRVGNDYAVRRVLRDMGGERAGIRVGDVVLAINNVRLDDITGIMWLRMEREARRTGRIQYTIRRGNVVSHLDVEWARRVVSEVISQMLAGDIGYIALRSRFMLGTGHEILEAVERLTAAGARSFIVDLRQNPGGSAWEMQIAISTFMRGALYIFRGPIFGNRVFSSVVAHPTDAGVAILVDSRSASAAEIFAFTLRNRPHTRIFGSDALTSGKGTGQISYMLANGWWFSFTTFQFFDVNNETYDNRGVAPHEVVTPLPDEAARGLSTADAIVQRAIAWLREQ